MKYLLPTTLALTLMMTQAVEAEELTTNKQQISYIMGMQIGMQMKNKGMDLDFDAFTLAVRDMLGNTASRLSQTQMQTALQQYQAEQKSLSSGTNTAEGKKFLEQNKSKADVVSLPSGLQYKILRAGTGASPKVDETVEVHYRGTLINGKEFDSSYNRGKPISFKVNGVIKGWTEALQLMKEGAKWQLFIPSNLAYGERGAGGNIGPNSTLLFDVELLKVK